MPIASESDGGCDVDFLYLARLCLDYGVVFVVLVHDGLEGDVIEFYCLFDGVVHNDAVSLCKCKGHTTFLRKRCGLSEKGKEQYVEEVFQLNFIL